MLGSSGTDPLGLLHFLHHYCFRGSNLLDFTSFLDFDEPLRLLLPEDRARNEL